MSDLNKLHKFHVRNLNKTQNRAIDFVESIEEIKIPEQSEKTILNDIINNKLFIELLGDKEKSKKMIKLFSVLKLNNIQSFFKNLEEIDRSKLFEAIKLVNKDILSDGDVQNMVDRIIVIHKIAIIKQIFSEQRISSAESAIKNYK